MGKGRDEGKGPSANQLRGLTYNDRKPKFLQNIGSALSGAPAARSDRPPIPTRPDDDPNGDKSGDEFDNNDYGEEAPQIVVLKEGTHLTAEEAEIEKTNAVDRPPIEKVQKKEGSLKFASTEGNGSSNKRKIRKVGVYDEEDNDAEPLDGGDSFGDLVKRAKTEPNSAVTSKEKVKQASSVVKPESSKASKTGKESKEEKAARKAKRKAEKSMLSFDDV